MSERTIYLFPDTNFFVQCYVPDQLDWSAWLHFEEVRLIVTRPVQREIDRQKNQGNFRVSRRARKTASMFRHLILSDSDVKVIREAAPCVKLQICPKYVPSKSVGDRLNYQECDDQLVGTVKFFIEEHPGLDGRLLTHDTGPMASAQYVGVPFVAVPDEWLMPPETTRTDKRLAELRAEVDRLKKTEPEFHIKCINAKGREIAVLNEDSVCYRPLNSDEVSELMGLVRSRCPMETNFGERESQKRPSREWGLVAPGMKDVFVPASDESIAAYGDEDYPGWLERCEQFLCNYHQTLQRDVVLPRFCFMVTNEGTRPGKDALLTIEAKGGIHITPASRVNATAEKKRRSTNLPAPPEPPQGRWHNPYSDAVNASASFALGLSHLTPDLGSRFDAAVRRERDPNELYWAEGRPVVSQSLFELKCEQWRHGVAAHHVEGAINVTCDEDVASGVLECCVHAENMSDAAVIRVPVRIAITHVPVLESARKLVAALTG